MLLAIPPSHFSCTAQSNTDEQLIDDEVCDVCGRGDQMATNMIVFCEVSAAVDIIPLPPQHNTTSNVCSTYHLRPLSSYLPIFLMNVCICVFFLYYPSVVFHPAMRGCCSSSLLRPRRSPRRALVLRTVFPSRCSRERASKVPGQYSKRIRN